MLSYLYVKFARCDGHLTQLRGAALCTDVAELLDTSHPTSVSYNRGLVMLFVVVAHHCWVSDATTTGGPAESEDVCLQGHVQFAESLLQPCVDHLAGPHQVVAGGRLGALLLTGQCGCRVS